MSDEGVHFDKEKDLALKQICQLKFEQMWNHEMFMKEFGKNYL